jgi:hypothetical protein
MPDRDLRDTLALCLEGFLGDQIDGQGLARGIRRVLAEAGDRGIDASPLQAVAGRLWHHYGESPHSEATRGLLPTCGARLSDRQWNEFARAALFLRSDRRMEWPPADWDPYETPDFRTEAAFLPCLILGLTAGFGAVAAFLTANHALGLVLGLGGLGLSLAALRLRRPAEVRLPTHTGDPEVFPFYHREDLEQELVRQAGGRVRLRPAGEGQLPEA